MFWGLVLKTNKRYSQQVTKAFHVSQATLDLTTLNPNDSDAIVQVWLHTDDTDHLLANVNRQTSHVRLDLAFTEGETVAFYSKGNGTVHLSGYLLPDDEDFGEGFPEFGGEEEEEESDQEIEAPAASKKQIEKGNKKQNKAGKEFAELEEEQDDDDEDDDDDDDSDDLDLDGLNEQLDEEIEDEEDSDDDDDEDDDDDDDDEDDSEEEVEAPPAKQAKFDKNAKQQNGLTNGKVGKKEQKQQQQHQQQQKNQKQDKHEQKQKNQQNQQPQKTGPKTLAGGVIIEDLRVGKGPEAKHGRKVSVYYEGRLKSNGKVFDSSKGGEGFKFALGRGEVIRGWDVGVAGMKVGSKRRITCPPNVAYGAKGAPPAIPGNATLVFDVELRGVN